MRTNQQVVITTLMAMTLGSVGFAGHAQGAKGMEGMDMSSDKKMDQTSDASNTAMSEGEVKKIDTSAGKLTIKHGPLNNLDMGAMTMVFRVKDPAMLTQVKEGDKIKFVAEKVNGALTVTTLQVQK
ncbi:copper-binding protein [Cupriavidus sp. CV2]|uniref:copper-binding protein n=1 Tax=Cupriavidus ulmosensis TaxID=3065913 RepID=UPI00296B29B3|nr:copper-binding protein [Cupriavidus sp. CV2]MDW3688954.1 copper-binding protein [Cupriavidus sp. CV2]